MYYPTHGGFTNKLLKLVFKRIIQIIDVKNNVGPQVLSVETHPEGKSYKYGHYHGPHTVHTQKKWDNLTIKNGHGISIKLGEKL